MLLTSSCSQQNHTKNPQPLPMRCESTCHLVEHIISSWRKTKQKKLLSVWSPQEHCWTQCPPITASNVPILLFLRVIATRLFPHPQCPRTSRTFCLPFNYSSLSPTPTLITLSSPSSDTPPLPLVPWTHCELWHCRCFKGLFSDSLNAWLTSTLSLGNSYRSGVDRGGQRCSLPCCKKTPDTQQKTVRLTRAGCSAGSRQKQDSQTKESL